MPADQRQRTRCDDGEDSTEDQDRMQTGEFVDLMQEHLQTQGELMEVRQMQLATGVLQASTSAGRYVNT